jgi:hypothetical protein
MLENKGISLALVVAIWREIWLGLHHVRIRGSQEAVTNLPNKTAIIIRKSPAG